MRVGLAAALNHGAGANKRGNSLQMPRTLARLLGASGHMARLVPTVVARHTWVGEWDYWFISGANCAFAVLPEREDDAWLVRFDDWNDSAEELPRDRCHGGPRGLLDLDTDREAVADEAARRWDRWTRFAAGHPSAFRIGRAVRSSRKPRLREPGRLPPAPPWPENRMRCGGSIATLRP